MEHFTVVTGSNNSGKTALQRAARGVFQNTGGTAFIRHGSNKCSVLVDFGEDGSVLWTKGTSKRERPTYVVNGGEPIYPGSSVPDEVTAFGVAPIQCGGAEVWPTIAPQFTGQVFLLDRPGSMLAEAVADVERVTQLNGALRKSESEKRRLASTLKVRQADLVKYEGRLEHFDGLDDVLSDIDTLGVQQGRVQRLHRAVGTLTAMRVVLRAAEAQAKLLAPVADIAVPDAASLSVMMDEHAALEDIRDRLGRASGQVEHLSAVKGLVLPSDEGVIEGIIEEVEALEDLRARLLAAEETAALYAGIDEVLVEGNEHSAERIHRALDVLNDFRDRLRSAESLVEEQQRLLALAVEALEQESATTDALLEEFGECPVCGNPVGDHSC